MGIKRGSFALVVVDSTFGAKNHERVVTIKRGGRALLVHHHEVNVVAAGLEGLTNQARAVFKMVTEDESAGHGAYDSNEVANDLRAGQRPTERLGDLLARRTDGILCWVASRDPDFSAERAHGCGVHHCIDDGILEGDKVTLFGW